MTRFYATPPLQTVRRTQRDEVEAYAESCAAVHGTTATVNFVYCAVSVYVCLSVSGRGFYYPVTPKMPPMGTDSL